MLNSRLIRGREYFLQQGYYEVPLANCHISRWREVHDWCLERFGKENYSWTGSVFWFKKERDAFLFTVAWGQ